MYLQGSTSISNATDTVAITFSPAFATAPLVFANVINTSGDVSKLVLAASVQAFSTDGGGNYTGATVVLSGTTNSANYVLHWSAGGEDVLLPVPAAQQGVTLGRQPVVASLTAQAQFRIPLQVPSKPLQCVDATAFWAAVPQVAAAPQGPLQNPKTPLALATDGQWLYVGAGGRWGRIGMDGGLNWEHQPFLVPFREGEVEITPVAEQTSYDVEFSSPFTGSLIPRVHFAITNLNDTVELLNGNITERTNAGFTITFSNVPSGPVLIYYMARQHNLAEGGGGPDGSTAHAETHGEAGDDPVTITQAQVTGLVAALALKAALASPALTGTPTAPTAATNTDTTQIATTAFVKAVINALINAAPGALDTLDELAAALGDDANFATTVTNALAAKAPLAAPVFTGTEVTAPNFKIVPTALATSGSVALDFTGAPGIQTQELSGDVTFTTANLAAGRSKTILMYAPGSSRALTFPAWVFVGAAAPASIAADKRAVLSLTASGTTDATVTAAYAEQP